MTVTERGVARAKRDPDVVFASIVGRLSRQSADKHFDAYTDVPWDDPECAIDLADPCWQLWDGRLAWHAPTSALWPCHCGTPWA